MKSSPSYLLFFSRFYTIFLRVSPRLFFFLYIHHYFAAFSVDFLLTAVWTMRTLLPPFSSLFPSSLPCLLSFPFPPSFLVLPHFPGRSGSYTTQLPHFLSPYAFSLRCSSSSPSFLLIYLSSFPSFLPFHSLSSRSSSFS